MLMNLPCYRQSFRFLERNSLLAQKKAEFYCVRWQIPKVGDRVESPLFFVLAVVFIDFTGNKTFYDPVISELESHKFAVPTLIQSKFRDRAVVVSCDVSGVVCYRWIGEVGLV